jgi:hypothetical protein
MHNYLNLIFLLFFQNTCFLNTLMAYWVIFKVIVKLFDKQGKGFKKGEQHFLSLSGSFRLPIVHLDSCIPFFLLTPLCYFFLLLFSSSPSVHPLINAADIYISTYLMHWRLWGMHNGFVGT